MLLSVFSHKSSTHFQGFYRFKGSENSLQVACRVGLHDLDCFSGFSITLQCQTFSEISGIIIGTKGQTIVLQCIIYLLSSIYFSGNFLVGFDYLGRKIRLELFSGLAISFSAFNFSGYSISVQIMFV